MFKGKDKEKDKIEETENFDVEDFPDEALEKLVDIFS